MLLSISKPVLENTVYRDNTKLLHLFLLLFGIFFFQSCLLTVTVVKNLFLNRKLDIVHETLKKLVITFLERRVQFPMTVDTPRTYHSIQI